MKIIPNCKDITRLVLEGEEHRLGLAQRGLIRAHWMICIGCSNFGKQVVLMRKANTRWRKYTEE